MSDISVIIPVYNRAAVMHRALDSVLAQTVPAKEIIVVNDGSTDDTNAILLNRYPDVILLSQTHQGVSAARNTGIRAATGAWIALLDSDDTWVAEKLATQITALEANPEYRIIHSDEIWIRRGVRVNQRKIHRKYGGYIFRHCLPLCLMSPSSVIIHKKIFAEVGLFDESLPVCEDYDMWLRICARYPVLYLEKALITKYGGHSDQLSRQMWGMDRFRILALKKILTDTILQQDDRTAAITMLRKKIIIYLNGAKKHGTDERVAEFEKLLEQYPEPAI